MTALALALAVRLASPPPGLAVEAVEAGYAAAMAGVRAGDVLLAWREESGLGRHGALRSPFTLDEISGDALLRGPVTLQIRRAKRTLRITVPADADGLRIASRPLLAPPAERLYRRGRHLVDAGARRAGTALWRQAAGLLAGRGREAETARCALLVEIAQQWTGSDGLKEARAAFAEAQECVEPLDLGWLAAVLERQGRQEMEGGQIDVAVAALEAALDLREGDTNPLPRFGPERALLALDPRRGRLLEGLERARAMRERCRAEIPGSLLEADLDGRIAYLHQVRGEGAAADAALDEALAIAARAGPTTATWTRVVSLMGGSRYASGASGAEEYYRMAAARQLRWAPEHPDTVGAFMNMHVATQQKGDLAASRRWLDRAVKLAAKPAVARTMPALRRALLYGQLAYSEETLGRWSAATALLYEKALRILAEAGPGHYFVASFRCSLGRVLWRLGRREEAFRALYAALEHAEAFEAGSLWHGSALLELGNAALDAGELDVAEEAYAQAAPIMEATMPLTPQLASVLAGRGRVALRRGRAAEAEAHLHAAADVVEASRQPAGRTDEARALFASGLYGIYQDLVDLLAAQGRTAEAFASLEKSHARSLLALLAERRIDDLGLPPELEAERKRLDAAYDDALQELQGAPSPSARTGAATRLDDLREQREALAVRIRRQAPGVASFRYPLPLDAGEIAARLDPGTLLIAYSTGETRTLAFALSVPADGGPFALRTAVIPKNGAAVRRRVAAWRRRIESAAPDPDAARESHALYDLLVRPLAPELSRARRVILVPDGALHGLPFAALHDGTRFLAETVPSSVAPSGTLAALWAQRRDAVPSGPPILFADPAGGALPGSRAEAAAIAASFPDAVVNTGRGASEERAKALPRGARFVHFAVHGAIDPLSPLDSALALRGGPRGSRENGLLQAWEILERVRLDTDLVTLSACRSADGPERAGEGTMGLVRAFQYAGARSVLASLWPIGDRSTAAFMGHFYGALAHGAEKAEALRAAQRAAIREGWQPARWASFQLYGDWK